MLRKKTLEGSSRFALIPEQRMQQRSNLDVKRQGSYMRDEISLAISSEGPSFLNLV